MPTSVTKSSAKAKAKAKATPIAVTPTAVAPPVVPKSVSSVSGSQTTERLQALQGQLADLTATLRGLVRECTAVQKEYAKEKRAWERQVATKNKKKKANGGVVHQSGIAKPGFISPELCKFIGVDTGTEMARTEVIKHVNQYIKSNNLQNEQNRRIILPDSKLRTLLRTTNTDEVTYFNLQTFMKPHYANPEKASAIA